MLYLIGIGLKPGHLSLEALNRIKKCEKIFLDSYTSFYSEGKISKLEEMAGKKILKLSRKEVEEGSRKIVQEAKSKNVSLLVFGNPLTATTHQGLLLELKAQGVEFEVVPGISITNFLGFTGLSEYKFGRTSSIVFPSKGFAPSSFYEVISGNQEKGLHTLCLLDIKKEEEKFMSIQEAIEVLEGIEKEKHTAVLKNAVLVGLSGAGGKKMKSKAGSAEELKEEKFGSFPQSLVVCGKLDENEKEFLKEFSEWNEKNN